MSELDRKRLRDVQTLPALVKYLREDLGWPIEQDSFDTIEDLTFDWDAEELGIDPRHAAKVEYVKQLRPLENGQPQGVFFVKFDTRQLPMVVMRKLLQALVVKKRASARAADRPMWEMQDLVFISSYGESTERQLSFAYFQEPEFKDELPALRVLGWDDKDTPLHLDKVHDLLRVHLKWPEDPKYLPQWRAQWSTAFQVGPGESVRTARDLAEELAGLARRIREQAKQLLRIETDRGPLRSLMGAFKRALIHDLTDKQFADMYAQTIAYGLLSARITHPDPLKAETLPDLIPITNPFLKELMETFIVAGGKHRGKKRAHLDFDELGINDVVSMLRRANMDDVLRDFGAKDRKEDPVLYFYEGFSKAYDPAERLRRGEVYTPLPLVSYVVSSVHRILQTEFDLEDGLASTATWGELCARYSVLTVPAGATGDTPFVKVLDPAAGTGTFLVEVIETVYATLMARWQKEGMSETERLDAWNEYVPAHLLPRLYGYEIKMAPYAIAHLKIGLKLFESGYRFGSSERARVYLTNALEPPTTASYSQIDALSEALAHEAQAVDAVKAAQQFTIILGNPPYSNFGQLNRNEYILDLLKTYKANLRERKLNLDDDYIKFFRLSEHLIQRYPLGILSLISNSSYLDGATHRAMRKSLLSSFSEIRVLNLHGNVRRKEVSPDGSRDGNVFDIIQGVAIFTGTRDERQTRHGDVIYSDLWGSREKKYQALQDGVSDGYRFRPEEADPELAVLIPQDLDNTAEYATWPSLVSMFPTVGQGIQTKQDSFCIDVSRAEIERRIKALSTETATQLKSQYGLKGETPSWSLARAMKDVRDNAGQIIRIGIRPFDTRFTFYTGTTNGFHSRPRRASTDNLLARNVAIIAKRQCKEDDFSSAWVTSIPINEGFFSIDPRGRETLFPLFAPTSSSPQLALGIEAGRRSRQANVDVSRFAHLGAVATPENVFAYTYAVLHSERYRAQYGIHLKRDFPRIPCRPPQEGFGELARLGGELILLHAGVTLEDVSRKPPERRALSQPHTSTIRVVGEHGGILAKRAIRWESNTITLGPKLAIEGVPLEIWQFTAGGYQVCDKWLKGRADSTLSTRLVGEFLEILSLIKLTIHAMRSIDRSVASHPTLFAPADT